MAVPLTPLLSYFEWVRKQASDVKKWSSLWSALLHGFDGGASGSFRSTIVRTLEKLDAGASLQDIFPTTPSSVKWSKKSSQTLKTLLDENEQDSDLLTAVGQLIDKYWSDAVSGSLWFLLQILLSRYPLAQLILEGAKIVFGSGGEDPKSRPAIVNMSEVIVDSTQHESQSSSDSNRWLPATSVYQDQGRSLTMNSLVTSGVEPARTSDTKCHPDRMQDWLKLRECMRRAGLNCSSTTFVKALIVGLSFASVEGVGECETFEQLAKALRRD